MTSTLTPVSTALTVGVRSVTLPPPNRPATAPARRAPHRASVTSPRRRRIGLAVTSMTAVLAAALWSPTGTGVASVAGSRATAAPASAVTDSWSGGSRRVVSGSY